MTIYLSDNVFYERLKSLGLMGGAEKSFSSAGALLLYTHLDHTKGENDIIDIFDECQNWYEYDTLEAFNETHKGKYISLNDLRKDYPVVTGYGFNNFLVYER